MLRFDLVEATCHIVIVGIIDFSPGLDTARLGHASATVAWHRTHKTWRFAFDSHTYPCAKSVCHVCLSNQRIGKIFSLGPTGPVLRPGHHAPEPEGPPVAPGVGGFDPLGLDAETLAGLGEAGGNGGVDKGGRGHCGPHGIWAPPPPLLAVPSVPREGHWRFGAASASLRSQLRHCLNNLARIRHPTASDARFVLQNLAFWKRLLYIQILVPQLSRLTKRPCPRVPSRAPWRPPCTRPFRMVGGPLSGWPDGCAIDTGC